jgi:hypothetical protein
MQNIIACVRQRHALPWLNNLRCDLPRARRLTIATNCKRSLTVRSATLYDDASPDCRLREDSTGIRGAHGWLIVE